MTRGSGRTTAQLKALPINSVFIVHDSNSVLYTLRLCSYLNRNDIRVVTPDWLTDRRWQGIRYSWIDIDHGVYLTEEQQKILPYARDRVQNSTSIVS